MRGLRAKYSTQRWPIPPLQEDYLKVPLPQINTFQWQPTPWHRENCQWWRLPHGPFLPFPSTSSDQDHLHPVPCLMSSCREWDATLLTKWQTDLDTPGEDVECPEPHVVATTKTPGAPWEPRVHQRCQADPKRSLDCTEKLHQTLQMAQHYWLWSCIVPQAWALTCHPCSKAAYGETKRPAATS